MRIEEILQHFIRFIEIPSVTGSEGEAGACTYLERLFKAHGIPVERIARSPQRPNLLAWIHAPQPTENPLVLISHIDVVDAASGTWRYPPFQGVQAEGRIWGRGTLDTKHLTMMELYAFLDLWERKDTLCRDVWFLATVDEEAGSSFGMEYVKAARPDLFKDVIVINEGGGFPLHINGRDYMMITMGEKTVCKVGVRSGNDAGHGNGSEASQKLVERLDHILNSEQEMRFGSHKIWDRMKRIVGSEQWDNETGRELLEYSGKNSVSRQKIKGKGDEVQDPDENVLEFKMLPGTSRTDIEDFLDSELKGSDIRYEIISFEPGFENDMDEEGVRMWTDGFERTCHKYGFTCRLLPMFALGRTDGRFFGNSKNMVFGYSPVLPGDSFDIILPKVHGVDESILEQSFLFGCQVLKEIVNKNCIREERDEGL